MKAPGIILSILLVLVLAHVGQAKKVQRSHKLTRSSEQQLTKQLLKLVHKLYQNQTMLERKFVTQKHELDRVNTELSNLRNLITSVARQQKQISRDAQVNSRSIDTLEKKLRQQQSRPNEYPEKSKSAIEPSKVTSNVGPSGLPEQVVSRRRRPVVKQETVNTEDVAPGFKSSPPRKSKIQEKPKLVDNSDNEVNANVISGVIKKGTANSKKTRHVGRVTKKQQHIEGAVKKAPQCNHGVTMTYVHSSQTYQKWCVCKGAECEPREKRKACHRSCGRGTGGCLLKKLKAKSTVDDQIHQFVNVECKKKTKPPVKAKST